MINVGYLGKATYMDLRLFANQFIALFQSFIDQLSNIVQSVCQIVKIPIGFTYLLTSLKSTRLKSRIPANI